MTDTSIPLEQFQALEARLAEKERQIELFARRGKLDTRFATIRQTAEQLRDAGKLTPAEFNELFSNALPDLEKFASIEASVEALSQFEALLGHLDFYLERIGKRAPIQFGMPTNGAAIESPDNAEKSAKAFCERHLPKISYR